MLLISLGHNKAPVTSHFTHTPHSQTQFRANFVQFFLHACASLHVHSASHSCAEQGIQDKAKGPAISIRLVLSEGPPDLQWDPRARSLNFGGFHWRKAENSLLHASFSPKKQHLHNSGSGESCAFLPLHSSSQSKKPAPAWPADSCDGR